MFGLTFFLLINGPDITITIDFELIDRKPRKRFAFFFLNKLRKHHLFNYYFNLSVHVLKTAEGYCFNGDCPTLSNQCERIWGYGGTAADRQCYDQFNTKGSINGHCGIDVSGKFLTCAPE